MNLEETRVLVAHGADVNAVSEDLRTPLMIAAGYPAGLPIVKLLLQHGANPNPTRHPDTESSPLVQAALAASPEMIQLLIDRGADVKASATAALVLAFTQDCRKCADLLMKQNLDKDVYSDAPTGGQFRQRGDGSDPARPPRQGWMNRTRWATLRSPARPIRIACPPMSSSC